MSKKVSYIINKKRSRKQRKLNRLFGIAIELCLLSINLEKILRIFVVQDCIQYRIPSRIAFSAVDSSYEDIILRIRTRSMFKANAYFLIPLKINFLSLLGERYDFVMKIISFTENTFQIIYSTRGK